MIAAAIRQAFIQPHHESAVQTWRHAADQLRARWPKLGAFMDDAEPDVLAYMAFPAQHCTKLHSTNPLERLNKEVKCRADVVGIFHNEDSIVQLIEAVLLEANDKWRLQHRYMQVEAMAELNSQAIEEEKPLQIRLHQRPPDHDGPGPHPKLHHLDGRYQTSGYADTTKRRATKTIATPPFALNYIDALIFPAASGVTHPLQIAS